MTKIILTFLLTLPWGLLLALDRSVYVTLEKELVTLVDGAGDVWACSGSGGYVLKFQQDVSGGPEKELFVNFSVRPNVWYIFAGNDNRLIGDTQFPSFGFAYSAKENGQTRILSSYESDSYAEPPLEPFVSYVFEKVISETGIESKVRKVGVSATESEFNNLRLSIQSAGITWAKPVIEAIPLEDLLLEPKANWVVFDPDKAEMPHGYYRLPGDEDRFSPAESTFTPKVALEALKRKLSASPE